MLSLILEPEFPLMYFACLYNASIEIFSLLLDAGGDANWNQLRSENAQTGDDEVRLPQALARPQAEMVLEDTNVTTCIPEEDEMIPFEPELSDEIYHPGWQTDKGTDSVIHHAAATGNLQLMQLLLSRAGDPSSMVNLQSRAGNTPVTLALRKGHQHVVELLVQHGVEIPDKAEEK